MDQKCKRFDKVHFQQTLQADPNPTTTKRSKDSQNPIVRVFESRDGAGLTAEREGVSPSSPRTHLKLWKHSWENTYILFAIGSERRDLQACELNVLVYSILDSIAIVSLCSKRLMLQTFRFVSDKATLCSTL